MIALRGVRKAFAVNGRSLSVLDGISFELAAGSFTTLFGPNGCGKSTLMYLLAGLESADGGEIIGADRIRGEIGFVFQDYRRSLLPWLSARGNILFPLGLRGVPRRRALRQLAGLMEATGIELDLKQPVFTLSGGQAQMVAILRALIIDPRLLILDEPFSALDFGLTLKLRQTMLEIAAKMKLTTLFISHDLEEALYLGDRVIFLTRRPAAVAEIVEVPLGRARRPALVASPEFGALRLKALEIVQRC